MKKTGRIITLTITYVTLIMVTFFSSRILNVIDQIDSSGQYDYQYFKVDPLTIDAYVNTDASMNVKQSFTYVITSYGHTFLYQEILKKGFSEMVDIEVLQNNQAFKYVETGKDCYSANLAPQTYCVSDTGTSYIIGWGIQGYEDLKQTYQVNYKVLDAIQVYQDAALLDYKMVGSGWSEPFFNVHINVYLPSIPETRLNDVYAFGHGPLSGEVTFKNASHIQFTVGQNAAQSFIETTVLFPSEFMDVKPTQIIPSQILEKRLALEKEWTNDSTIKPFNHFVQLLIGLVLVTGTGFILVQALKRKKTFKAFDTSAFPKYQRELDLTEAPAYVHALMSLDGSKYDVSTAISATLLSLVQKKAVEIETISKKEFVYINHMPNDSIQLDKVEALLHRFMFEKINDQPTILQSEFEKQVKKQTVKSSTFYKQFESILNKKRTSYKDGKSYSISATGTTLIVFLSVLLTLMPIIIRQPDLLVYVRMALLVILGVSSILYATLSRLTLKASEQYAYWLGVRNFLNDFSRLEAYELPHFIMWEEYMVYAVALGNADKVIQQLDVLYPEMQTQTSSMSTFYRTYFYTSMIRRNMFGQSIQSSHYTRVNQVRSSSRGSGTRFGGGGGFSGGGGFGGGGGGGGIR